MRTDVSTGEPTAEVGIALKRQEGEKTYFETGEAERAEAETVAESAVDREAALGESTWSEPTDVLPRSLDALGIGPAASEAVETPSAQQGTKGRPDGAALREKMAEGRARVGIFGAEGEGYKFAFVFDRSSSMDGGRRNALRAAKAQLLAALEGLEQNHQFQIIFYNERPFVFNPTGQAGKLVFATDRNRAMARKFIGSITAAGGTEHEQPLLMALGMRPDVIFFLTDADEPQMTAGQLASIARKAAGITIHTIEFGYGPQQDANNFLVRLARQNGGKHTYIDISRLGR